GVIIQYIARVIFSFNYKKSVKYFGSLWGGLAITGITYFILIKGAKGSSFISKEQIAWISDNSALILGICFVGWTSILQLLNWLFNVNQLKVIVLFGTFALAMAFAGNDLVNFIGVPMAGYESFRVFSAQEGLSGSDFTMTALMESVKTPTGFLLIAGIIMVLSLWFSKKARTVTQTELSLGNQDQTNERFASSAFARSLVRIGVQLGKALWAIVPAKLKPIIQSRFDDSAFKKQAKKDKGLSFDLVRASVNLAVSSSLIAFATSHKLPLSTTYVTFMVAMSTSLADKAWGRESAVYRISGVITVIGGWFFTAFVAFTGAFLMALLMSWGGMIAVGLLIAIAIVAIYKTHTVHKKRVEETKASEREFWADEAVTGAQMLDKYNNRVALSIVATADLYEKTIEGLIDEKRKKLGKAEKEIRKLSKDIRLYKKNAHLLVSRLEGSDLADDGEYYFLMLDHLNDIAHYVENMAGPAFSHIDNNHEPLPKADAENLKDFLKEVLKYSKKTLNCIATGKFDNPEEGAETLKKLVDELSKMRKSHLKRFKSGNINTGVSLLYLDILAESKNLVLGISAMSRSARNYSITHPLLLK
ncbi:MAG: inorganic phosphate transporter, partial [Bacteroidales bacterium]|nr:inorganic phosphate transporter [Bacteroidales bacterium]